MAQSKLTLVLGRLAQAIPTLVGVIVVTFVLTRALPGDPAAYFAGPAADAKSIAQIRESLGLDRPLPEQFLLYLKDLARGEMGNSISTGQPVAEELIRRLPASLELTFFALLLSLAIAQAVADYRQQHNINGPLFLGRDTHALSQPAWQTTLQVLNRINHHYLNLH